MDFSYQTNFPDQNYLQTLIERLEKKAQSKQPFLEKFLTASGVSLNWIADYILDVGVVWEKVELEIDQLCLTGTNPEWNKYIIEKCERSPEKLKELFRLQPEVLTIFSEVQFDGFPILVRFEEEKYKVFDGMHRVIAAIRDGKNVIEAFVAKIKSEPKPVCEPHVVYDFLRSYQRGINKDKAGLVAALKYLRKSYANVDWLLQNRFQGGWALDEEIVEIIREVLK